ncbi:uncharacterized protein PG986_000958 [Apiospora aurea]|uniref:Microbial-type PARG catalytic domain-containing protein n=1 Tax=Apiospora aurea TaxID=335848 RepID=A0ABR1QVH0_9PEZI
MPSSKPRPAEVAQETKRHYLPMIKAQYSEYYNWPCYSYLYHHPIPVEHWPSDSYREPSLAPPQFSVTVGDPVDLALEWAHSSGDPDSRIPFIAAANDKRPRAGGDWETGVVGYEERFCRRSTLSLTLSTPAPNSPVDSNYPIPSEGCIYSGCVVVFRGPHEQYTKWEPENWSHLPVVSVPAARWPKLNQMGTKFAFDVEKELVRAKIRAALAACVYNGHNRVLIGNFGLGNSARNPARELAELWREVFLYDPDFRGRFVQVCFVFEDLYESTTRLIFEDMSKKAKGGGSSSSKSKSRSHGSSSSSAPTSATPSDYDIFAAVFDNAAIQSVLTRQDPRCNISMLTS